MIAHAPPPAAAYISRSHGRLPPLITHIVVVIQENRSIDNLFNGFCAATSQCANTLPYDPYTGRMLQSFDLTHGGPGHSHEDFETEYNSGHMNGFSALADSDVPSTDTTAYQQMFTADGILNDNILAPNMGPSFPAHLYGIAGQAGGYDPSAVAPGHWDIADNPGGDPTYCGGGGMVESVSLASTYPGSTLTTSICRDHNTIFDQLATNPSKGYTWKYYANFDSGSNLWAPTKAIAHLVNSPNFDGVPSHIVDDIHAGSLPSLAFVSPLKQNSDHPGQMNDNWNGQRWVASVVNAVGQSSYWNNTVIILYWDDWGGFFDHVLPKFAYDPFLPSGQNPNEYGFRLSYGVISQFAKRGIVAHGTPTGQPCSASDSLAFIEQAFGLTPLGTEDILDTGCTAGMIAPGVVSRPFVPIVVPGSTANRHHRT